MLLEGPQRAGVGFRKTAVEFVPKALQLRSATLSGCNKRGGLRCNNQNDLHADPRTLTESVERLVVDPVVRTAPWDPDRLREQDAKQQVYLLLISESDVCRSVLAAASLRALLADAGLAEQVQVATCATRPYNVGEGPEPAAAAVVEALGLEVPETHSARLFDPAYDIVSYDLLLVMDKFTAGDVMREVSSFDLVNRTSQFSYKVRRLGEFLTATHGSASYLGSEGEELDIEDPLYGNIGGEEEERAVLRTARTIYEACRGLVAFLQGLREVTVPQSGGTAASLAERDAAVGAVAAPPASTPSLGQLLRARVRSLGPTGWLVPPLLSGRVSMESDGAW